ncbi:MAG: hypothetical protein ACR2QF_10860 [Geminicoccaceae bacterium]
MAGTQTSNKNRSVTPLAGDATFTGTGELNYHPDVMVICQTDAAGTLFFDFSLDDGNWTTFPVNGFVVADGINEIHVAVKGPRWFRARYVNGSSAQTYFRLSTFYGEYEKLNAPLNQSIGSDAGATIVRSVDSILDLQRGQFGGMSIGDKFGYSSGLGTSIQDSNPASWADLWAYGGQRTSPSGSFTPFMASDDSADTSIDIEWTYQDAAGVEQIVMVATDASDGQTPVSLGVTATEVYRGKNSGSADLAGGVSCTTANNFTAGVPDNQNEVLAHIPIGSGQTQVLAGRAPANKLYLLQSLALYMSRSSGAAGSGIVDFQIRKSGEVFVSKRHMSISTSYPIQEDLRALNLEAGDDYRTRIRDISDNSTTISGGLLFYAVDV